MRIDWLESFATFAETKNFTHAAERLHISQPALHVQITRLGEHLGVPLYRRRGRALELTGEGRKVEAFAREICARIDAFEQGLRDGEQHATPVLCAGYGTQLYMLGEPLRRWVKRGAPVRLSGGDREHILEAVLSGRAHLGIAPLDVVPDELDAVLFRTVGQAVVVPRTHPLAGRKRLRIDNLHGEQLILPPADRPHRQAVARAFAARSGPAEVALEAEGWELMMSYAALGLGIAVVNDYCRPPAGTVAVALPELPALRYYLLTRRDGYLPPAAERLHAHLERSASRR